MAKCIQCGAETSILELNPFTSRCRGCSKSNAEKNVRDRWASYENQKVVAATSVNQISRGPEINTSGLGLMMWSIGIAILGSVLLYGGIYGVFNAPRGFDNGLKTGCASLAFFAISAICGYSGAVRWGVSGAEYSHLRRIEKQNERVLSLLAQMTPSIKPPDSDQPTGSTQKSEQGR